MESSSWTRQLPSPDASPVASNGRPKTGNRVRAENAEMWIESTRRENRMSVLNAVLLLLKKEERLQRELSGITAAIAAFGKAYVNGKSARSLSTAGQPKIAAANRTRGAKARKTRKIVPMTDKRTLSATVEKKAAATQKTRWAKLKAAKKTA
jgi:hypothetical protein